MTPQVFFIFLGCLIPWLGSVNAEVLPSNQPPNQPSNIQPGLIKPNQGYSGNLLIFQANATFGKDGSQCDLTLQTPDRQGSDEVMRHARVDWTCNEGADLVIGTYFSRGRYKGPNYEATIFYTPYWLGLSHHMEPLRFSSLSFSVSHRTTLHLYLSKFSHVSYDQPLGLRFDPQGDYQWITYPGHYTFDLESTYLELDLFPGLDLAASGLWLVHEKQVSYLV